MESLQVISQIASGALISSIWQGMVLASLIWICLKFARRTSAGMRFLIWSAVFVAAAALPLLSMFAGHSGVISGLAPTDSNGPILALDARWALGIVGVWAAFAVGRLFVLARNVFRVRGLWKSSTPIELTPALEAILGQHGLRGATLCTSPTVDQPCVIGFSSPRILIPGWLLESATASELEQIVLHESAHLRRFDDWTNLAQKLVLALYPFSPALFWIERRLCAEREVACDESVVRATNAPRDYATCLTHLAEQRLTRRNLGLSGVLSLGALERRSQLAGRVESILFGQAKLNPMKARVLMLSLMLATLGGAMKLGSTAQLVSFATPQTNAPVADAIQTSAPAGLHYQDVVFHPAAHTPSLAGDAIAPAKSAKHPVVRPIAETSPHHSQQSGNRVKSLVIVTRWQSADGQQMTVINQVVRISALSAAQLHGGWFVVQL